MVLAIIAVTAVFGRSMFVAVGGIALVACLYAAAGIPFRIAFRQLLAPIPIIVFIGAITWWKDSLTVALCTAATLLTAIGVAILLSSPPPSNR